MRICEFLKMDFFFLLMVLVHSKLYAISSYLHCALLYLHKPQYLDVTQFCISLDMVCSVLFNDIISCYGRNFAYC